MDRDEIKLLLQENLEELKDTLLRRAQDQKTESIIVTGDFARGELSIVKEGEKPIFISKCRVTVIMSQPLDIEYKKELYDRLFAPLPNLKLIPSILDIYDLPLIPASFEAVDLKRGGCVIYGNQGILARIPNFKAADISLACGLERILLALSRLLRVTPSSRINRDQPPADRMRMIYECTEALWAGCDALLLIKGRIALGLREKQICFTQYYANEPLLQELFDEALRYRLDVSSALNMNAGEYWIKIKNVVADILVRYFGHFTCCSCTSTSLQDTCRFLSNLYPDIEGGKSLSSRIEFPQSFEWEETKEHRLRSVIEWLQSAKKGRIKEFKPRSAGQRSGLPSIFFKKE